MKKLFIIIIGIFNIAYGQTTGYFRYDTTRFEKNGGNNEVYIRNGTKAVTGGVLTNVGNGLSRWIAPAAYGDSLAWKLTGNASTVAGTNFIGTTDSVALWLNTKGVNRLIIPAAGIASSTASTDSVLVTKTDGVTLGKIAKSALVTTPDLQAVTDVGNTTTNNLIVNIGGGTLTRQSGSAFEFKNTATNFEHNISVPTVTANRSAYLQDTTGTIAYLHDITTPTWQQTLTAGSTLTTDNSVDAGGFDFFITNLRDLDFLTNFNGRFSVISGGNAVKASSLIIDTSSISIQPNLGKLYIDTLTSAVGTKALRYNPISGLVSYSDTTTAGGGGISGLTTNELVYGNSATTIASLPVATYPSLTELSYVKGLTSNAQTQIDGKWGTLGTGGTSSGTNYFGTSDNKSMFIRTNTTNAMKIDSNQNLQVGAFNNTMSSTGSLVIGNSSTANFQSIIVGSGHSGFSNYQQIFGSNQAVYNDRGFAQGISNIVVGSEAAAFGRSNYTRAAHEFSLGYYGTDYTATGSLTDRLFNIGASQDGGTTRKNAMTILRDGRIGIGIRTSTAAASAVLDIESTTKGLLIPRMTTTQQNAIVSPATGLIIWNTDTAGLVNYTGSAWLKVSQGGGSGEVNTASNLGGGLANYDSKSGVDLRFNSFDAADFDLATNLISIDATKWLTISAAAAAYQPLDADLTTWAGITPAANVGTFLATPSSANLRSAVTDENGTGALLFSGATSPDFTTSVTVGGVAVPTISSTNTLTNKRITMRTGTVASSATPTINTDDVDLYTITAQTVDITSMTTNLSGTPTEGQLLTIEITGTASRAITWGASFAAGLTALPTTTSGTSTLGTVFIRRGSLWVIKGTY